MASRVWRTFCKLIQRQAYSCLSTRYGLLFTFLGLCAVIVAGLHFGEIVLKWSMIRYAGRFHISRYYDNIGCKSFETRLCLPQPIDVVYTWVNGSDPLLIARLNKVKKEIERELNKTAQEEYANKKKRGKLINSSQFKWKSAQKCPFPNCIRANKLAVSGIQQHTSLLQVKQISSLFRLATKVEFWDEDLDVAFMTFESHDDIQRILNKTSLTYKDKILNATELFYTSTIKNGHKRIANALMLHDVLETDNENELTAVINSKLPDAVISIHLYPVVKLGIVFMKDETSTKNIRIISKSNLTLNGRRLKLFPVTYVWKPITQNIDNQNEDFSANRFADNNELKYSLRSVERFAPWVRKVFLVTNGQVPNWLDLSHPRITLVTHDEIFVNKSHLPTFSSPAIETHIHRIPGLSKKFIYMNDDVFFGAQVWPDDFFTHSKGHKIYLSWTVPNCNEGCPGSWINDKYCDRACNVSACDWDGGDCLGDKGKKSWQLQATASLFRKKLLEACSPGCALNWMGDRYCDGNCNTLNCAFDAGDCGVQNFPLLYSYTLTSGDVKDNMNITITVPTGTLAMYVNLTKIFDSVVDGNFADTTILRNAVLSKKFKFLSLTFLRNISETVIDFQVLGFKQPNETVKSVVFFKLKIDTKVTEKEKITQKNGTDLNRVEEDVIPSTVYPESAKEFMDDMNNKNSKNNTNVDTIPEVPRSFLNQSLPSHLQQRLKRIQEEFSNEELTEYGFNKSLGLLYSEYIHDIHDKHAGRKLLSFGPESRLVRKTDDLLNDDLLNDETNYLPWEKGTVGRKLKDMVQRISTILKYRDLKDKNLGRYLNSGDKVSYKHENSNQKTRSRHANLNHNQASKRRLLDAYSASLLHVSRIFNKAFGYKSRKVPAHMPHMVDRDVIYEMQARFAEHFDATSSHQLRHPEDMQFAFSFNYYVAGVKDTANISTLFDEVDTDYSGTLSDRELHTLTAILYPLPLKKKDIHNLESHLKNCSRRLFVSTNPLPSKNSSIKKHDVQHLRNVVHERTSALRQEKYFDTKMPLVTKQLFMKCHEVWRLMNTSAEKVKYKHEFMGEEDLAFKMIRNNVSQVLHQLDWIRKHRRKFVCVNDDLDHEREDSKQVRELLKEFYESYFPVPSQFELAANKRNRFLYRKDLDAWKVEQDANMKKMNSFVGFVIFLLVFGLYHRKILSVCKRFCRVLYRGRER